MKSEIINQKSFIFRTFVLNSISTAMMEAVKGIPYGVARFEDVRNGNFYYVDKTMYLPLLEDTGNYLFLIRPRRFGKSVFVSMMQAYYDIAQADKFDRLFSGLWIQEHPTHCAGGQVRPAVQRALDTGASHTAEEQLPGDLLRLLPCGNGRKRFGG